MDEKIKKAVEELLAYAAECLDMYPEDEIFRRNSLLDALRLDSPADSPAESFRPLREILADIGDYAEKKKLFKEGGRINFETRIMGLVTPMPYQVISTFDDLAGRDVNAALEYLRAVSVNSNYIRMADIDKNIGWTARNPRGDIMITINLAKPEKNIKDVAAARKAPQTGYPKCVLCAENVGFAGNETREARQTLRAIPLSLAGEEWFFQFSPYVYFDGHCIVLSREHTPMNITEKTFERLFDFVDLFPDYFLGSNAALPGVGGSILSHDHYQGGKKVLPELSAPPRKAFTHPAFPDLSISIVDWYNSVIRIEGRNRADVSKLASHVLSRWLSYSDAECGIKAFTGKEPHNTLSPVARLDDSGKYVLDLILRNNRADKERPDGIFHPPAELQNIKKESIGLIEAMGLFILPGRLSSEALGIRDILTGKTPLDFKALSEPGNPLGKHIGMIAQLANDLGTGLSEEEAGNAVTAHINGACERILDCTAVFKRDKAGEDAFDRFMAECGF